jgi:NAD(P)H-dependent FMN reductase
MLVNKLKKESRLMKKLNILIIMGTSRPGAKSVHAASFVEKIAKQYEEIDVFVAGPAMFNLPNDGDGARDEKYAKLVEEADGFFIVTPEYNHSYPGSLKRLLDSEYALYNKKAVAVAGVSSGIFGGARAIQNLLPVLRKLGLVNIVPDVYFQNSNDLFNEKGEIVESKIDVYESATRKALDELIWVSRALKEAKKSNNSK